MAYTPTPTMQQQKPVVHDERILVVKREKILPNGSFQGIKQVDFDTYLKIITTQKEFLPRSLMENDPRYKQIIPYLVFEHDNNYFLMQRRKKASESRLQSKYSLGIGGHIRQEDMHNNDVFSWATREFHEEIDYDGTFTFEPIGLLNDDSNDVGNVHIGFVFLLHGSSKNIRIKSELQSGQLISLAACEKYADKLETWSSFVLDFLQKNNNLT